MRRRPVRRLRALRWAGWLLVPAPWAWFLVRDLDPLLEWGAVLLPLLGALVGCGLLALGLWLRSAALLAATASVAAFTATAVLLPSSPQPTGPPALPFDLLTVNVQGDNEASAQAAQDLLDQDADVVVAAEVSPLQQPVTRALGAAYPHVVRLPGEVAVWSRLPLSLRAGPGLPPGARGGRVEVDTRSGPVALWALHLFRPSRHAAQFEVTVQEQRRLVDEIDRLVRADPLPALLVGDLNVSARTTSYRVLTDGRVDAARSSGWTGPTSFRLRNRPLLLRIDHVLLPADWCAADARRVGVGGSDHTAVHVAVGPCRAGAGRG